MGLCDDEKKEKIDGCFNGGNVSTEAMVITVLRERRFGLCILFDSLSASEVLEMMRGEDEEFGL